ncbi:MAG: BMC domain-containing protein [Kiritimatiellae bacterium]|nr:BMC domain-containing protein [Kiritimatiellia bacterium]
MRKYPAIAVVEFQDIATGMYATDAMIKKAPIMLLKCGIISRGRYLTLIGGSTASVDEAYREGLASGKDSVIDHVLLADVHPQVHDAVLGRRLAGCTGALAIIETPTVSCNVQAAELALKATPVDLVEIRLADSLLSGKGVSVYRGELHDIEAAVHIAADFLKESRREVNYRIVPAPHESLSRQIDVSTYFMESETMSLEGEEVE